MLQEGSCGSEQSQIAVFVLWEQQKVSFLRSVWFTLVCLCQAELKKEAVPQQDDSDLEKKRREADALLQSMGITSDTSAGRSPTHLSHTHSHVSVSDNMSLDCSDLRYQTLIALRIYLPIIYSIKCYVGHNFS